MLDQSNNLIRPITKVDHPTTRCYVSLNRETGDFMVNNFNSINGNFKSYSVVKEDCIFFKVRLYIL